MPVGQIYLPIAGPGPLFAPVAEIAIYKQQSGRAEMRCLILCFLLVTGSAVSQQPQQTPRDESKQQTESARAPETDVKQQSRPSTPIGPPDFASDKFQGQQTRGDEQGTEFWAPIFGLRLKVADSLIALFTALMFFATLALYFATRDLVKGAEETARKQLRAYVVLTPNGIHFDNARPYSLELQPVDLVCNMQNYGQTPARSISSVYGIGVFPHPLPADFAFPEATNQTPQQGGALPQGVGVATHFNRQTPLTREEIDSLGSGNHKLWLWGVTTYWDIFGERRTTRFEGGFGGENFLRVIRDTFRAFAEAPFGQAPTISGEGYGLRCDYGRRHGEYD